MRGRLNRPGSSSVSSRVPSLIPPNFPKPYIAFELSVNAYLYERLSSSEDFYLEEVADVVEEGPEEYEGSEAQGRSVDDDFIDADEVLGRLESALGDDRASDGHVREPERGEPFQIGESQAAADDAGDDG